MRQSRKVVCKVIINVLFISIQNRRCRNYLTMKTCDSVQWLKRFTNSHSAYVAKNYIRFSTYVLKCHNTEEVILLYAKRFEKPKKKLYYAFPCGICNQGISTFIKRIFIMSHTSFRDCRVHFCAFFPQPFSK